MKDELTETQLVGQLQYECLEAGGQKQWAESHGFSSVYVNDVLRGKRAVSEKFAEAMGFERIVTFRRKK